MQIGNVKLSFSLCVVAAAVVACGGGGSDDNEPTTPLPQQVRRAWNFSPVRFLLKGI